MLAPPVSYISEVQPSLAVSYDKNTDGDIRFPCLTVFFDILLAFLDDISSGNTPEDHQPSTTISRAP